MKKVVEYEHETKRQRRRTQVLRSAGPHLLRAAGEEPRL